MAIMIDNLVQFVDLTIRHFGVPGVFLASFTEEVIAPIPSGIVMMSSGYAFLGGLPITLVNILYLLTHVALPLSLGLTLGSLFVYGLVYRYEELIVAKIGPYLGFSLNDVKKLHRYFEKGHKDELVLLVMRVLPIIPSVVINAVAGIIKIKPSRYITVTIIGTSIRAFVISFIGWQVGNVYKEYADVVDHFENYVLYTIIAIGIGFVIWKKLKKKKVN